jgi:NAD-dependent dihydropyrimidine dehydrogenase PreA subunit
MDAMTCKGPAGRRLPVIDRNRCEGKGDCVRVCPQRVFEVRAIEPAHRHALSYLGKIKSLVHGGRTAYTPRADDCLACGACVTACPETAIRLIH